MILGRLTPEQQCTIFLMVVAAVHIAGIVWVVVS
jgi:hypothetical protein